MSVQHSEQLISFSKELNSVNNLTDGLNCISKNAKKIMSSERCSIFLYDEKNTRLWTTLSDGRDKITIPSDIGIIGHTLRVKKALYENDPYDNPNFLSDVDMETGFYTKNLIAAPIFNSQSKIIGVLELLNRKGLYTKEDLTLIHNLAQNISSFIELYHTK